MVVLKIAGHVVVVQRGVHVSVSWGGVGVRLLRYTGNNRDEFPLGEHEMLLRSTNQSCPCNCLIAPFLELLMFSSNWNT
jgi:hypothetical protein